MSSNRLIYDTCAYKQNLNQSTSPLSYTLSTDRYENCNKCRMELGLVGGTNVSHIKGNLVDLETELRGITRKASLCSSQKYNNKCAASDDETCRPDNIRIQGDACTQGREIDTSLHHLQPCQMIRYKQVPLPPAVRLNSCPVNNGNNVNNVNNNNNVNNM